MWTLMALFQALQSHRVTLGIVDACCIEYGWSYVVSFSLLIKDAEYSGEGFLNRNPPLLSLSDNREMRREGAVGLRRTNHTVRASKCGAGVSEFSCSCMIHSHEAVEYAYISLQRKTGRERFSRLDLFEEATALFEAAGAYRTKEFRCDTGKCFRRANRPCSCPQCNNSVTPKKRRRELAQQLLEDVKYYKQFLEDL